MTTIVVLSLSFCVCVVVVGIILACFCVDISSIVSSALLLFGTELGICGLMKLYDKGVEQAERRAEERRKRRMSVKQAEWESKEELRENENEWSGKNHSSKFADSEIHRNDYAYGGFFVSGSGGAHQRRTVFDDFLCGGGVLLRYTVQKGKEGTEDGEWKKTARGGLK